MPRKPLSQAQRIRNMLDRGRTVKEICTTLDVKPQTVYNIRYAMNKAQGLGALPAAHAGTGIKRVVMPTAEPDVAEAAFAVASTPNRFAEPVAEPPPVDYVRIAEPPRRNLMQRVRDFFRSAP